MKTYLLTIVCALFLSSPVYASMTDAEAQAISTGAPRDCSLLIISSKKAECIDFNRVLQDCQATGAKAGLQLKSCMVAKGKIVRK